MLDFNEVPDSTERGTPPVVALAASAGGIPALRQVLAALPADFPAGIVIVLHLAPHQPHVIANILGRHCRLPVQEARGGEFLRPGRVFIAPPDHHLVVGPQGVLELSDSPPVHFVRPSADVLFTSLAASVGSGAVAVVLTGSGFDGANGVVEIKRHGGRVIVQDKSEFGGMPGAALATGCVDQVLLLHEIGPVLLGMLDGKEEA